MMCYLDRTFCSTDCINTTCYRNFSPAHKARAKAWWAGMKGEPPVAFSDFMCNQYMPPDNPCDDWSATPLPEK